MLDRKMILLLLAAGSVFPLAMALISQYGFGLHPCEMCLIERIPYSLIAILLFFIAFRPMTAKLLRRMVIVAVMLWAIEAMLAFYHVGIEQTWWDSATGCTANSSAGASMDDIKAAIMKGPIVSCADVAVRVLGLSMAGWNVVYALCLMVTGATVSRKIAYDQ